jgi:hypothetical protein
MYAASSLIRLLERHGFGDARELPAGQTTIPDPGPLDLREREEESVYVEAEAAKGVTPAGPGSGEAVRCLERLSGPR